MGCGLLIFLLFDEGLDFFAFVDVFDDGFVAFVFVVEDFGVLEVFDQAGESLEAGVGQYTDLNDSLSTLSLLNLIHLLLWNLS